MTDVNILWSENLYVKRNKSMFLTSNCCFWLRYESSIHIAFSAEKVILTESGEKYAQIKHCLQAKTILNKYVGVFDVRGQKDLLFYCIMKDCGSWMMILC